MKARFGFALALGLGSGPALACPCSDDAGSSAGLTREDERYAASLVATSRHALGQFDAQGRYSALGGGERESSEELLLRAGLRLPRRLEWVAELGYAAYRFHAPSVLLRQVGVGDALLHARYDLRREGMPHESWLLPAVAVAALLRVPLGTIADGRTQSFGSGGAQLGLGAWELGAGVEARRSLSRSLELVLGGEAAYRFEDHVLGRARRLGPRADFALGARVRHATWLSSSVAVRGRLTGDVSFAGRRLDGTDERLFSLVAGAAVFDAASRFRSSITLSVDPPLGSLSVGSTAAAALSVSLGYGVE